MEKKLPYTCVLQNPMNPLSQSLHTHGSGNPHRLWPCHQPVSEEGFCKYTGHGEHCRRTVKMQENKGWKTLRWDRKCITKNCLDWEMLWTEFQKWQETSKHKAKEGKRPFTELLTEMLMAKGTLLKGAEQWVQEAEQRAKDTEAWAFESCSHGKNQQLQWLGTNLRPLICKS